MAFKGEARCEMMTWSCHIIVGWIFQQWWTRMAMTFIVYIMSYSLFAINDIVSGCTHCYSRCTKTTSARWTERGRRLPFLCCVYATAYTSCAIHLVKSSVVDVADGLAQSGGNVFYNLLVDSMPMLLSGFCRLPIW